MFVAFKLNQDGELTYRKARPVTPGIMLDAVREARRGAKRSYGVRTFLTTTPDRYEYQDEEGLWQPLW